MDLQILARIARVKDSFISSSNNVYKAWFALRKILFVLQKKSVYRKQFQVRFFSLFSKFSQLSPKVKEYLEAYNILAGDKIPLFLDRAIFRRVILFPKHDH